MPTDNQNGWTDCGRWTKGIWPAALASSLEAMLGTKVDVECLPMETQLPAGSTDEVWWQTEFRGPDGALAYCGCPAQVSDLIGTAALSVAGVSAPSAKEARQIFGEIIGQSLSAFAQGCSRETECQRPASCVYVLPVKLVHSTQKWGPVWLVVSREFELMFAPRGQAAIAATKHNDSQPTQPKTMDLLFDVELPVSVSFGRTQLPLKDVIKLTTGSILELNRSIAEPVELIVNNCVIARGEVVVIEGNYAIRIQQIISRQERLRTLY